jgi:hypothetical protein
MVLMSSRLKTKLKSPRPGKRGTSQKRTFLTAQKSLRAMPVRWTNRRRNALPRRPMMERRSQNVRGKQRYLHILFLNVHTTLTYFLCDVRRLKTTMTTGKNPRRRLLLGSRVSK